MNRLMKRLLLFFITTFIIGGVKSQNKDLIIEYLYEDKSESIPSTAKLRAFHNEQIFTLTKEISMAPTPDSPLGEDVEDHTYFYKNRELNELIYKDIVLGELYVKEKLDLFKWEMVSGEATILNYRCQKAVTKFRGREYIAYFTTELPFKAAPWKFHGLPGVVLKVFSTDSFLTIEASALSTEKHKPLINPYRKEHTISWSDFVKSYKKGMKMVIASRRAHFIRKGEYKDVYDGAPPKVEILMEGNRRTFDQFIEQTKK